MKVLRVLCFFAFTITLNDAVKISLSGCARIKVKNGRARYRQRGRIANFLCNTGYILAGDRYSICTQGQWDTPIPKCVRSTCKKPKPLMNGLVYPSHAGAIINFYCKSGYDLHGANISYCDGTLWDNPMPTCLPTQEKPALFCDFEDQAICGWSHDLNHDFDWRRDNFLTPTGTLGTGSRYDHTKGRTFLNGYYMYTESTDRIENDTARLISPVYNKSELNVCFEFYYHMRGAHIGQLRIYMKKVNDPWNFSPDHALFVRKGHLGEEWHRGYIFLGPINDEFQIIIEGVRGDGYLSDIAADDVKVILNCTEEEIDTTTELLSTEPPLRLESCENRCNESDKRARNETFIPCGCDEKCLDEKSCCLDYFDLCVIPGPTLDEESTEVITSTPEITITETTSTVKETIKTIATTKYLPVTVTKKIAFTSPSSTPGDKKDVEEIPFTRSNDVETPGLPIKEGGVTTVLHSDKSDYKLFKEKITLHPELEPNNTKTIIFVIGVAFGVLLGLFGMVFIVKRYRLCNIKRMNHSSNGDSQSDVRFLTSDEAIDFTLPRDYDSL